MKIKIIISSLVLFFSLSKREETKESKPIKVSNELLQPSNSIVENNICERKIKLENTEICLPVIEGMKEVYMNSDIKTYVNKLLPKGSIALGYYINNQTYENLDKISEIEYDDYLFIFSTELLIKETISREVYNDLSNFEESYKFDWENQKTEIEKLLQKITVGKPAIFEKYNLNKNVTTLITLNRYIVNSSELTKITIGNTFYLKNKIIVTSYNCDYSGINSIRKAKEKNDYMVIRFLNENE